MNEPLATLGAKARGTFGAQQPADPRPGIDLITNGTFLRSISQELPGICGDGRCGQDGTRLPVPSIFGGFGGLVMADALTSRRWYKSGMTFTEHLSAMWQDVHAQFPGAALSLHTDDRAMQDHTPECGCAAIAGAPVVVQLLVEYKDMIDPAYRDRVAAHAQELLDAGYFQPGTAEVIVTAKVLGLQIEVLQGAHNGVVFVRNKKDGTIIDRPALYKAAAEQDIAVPYAFEIDEWALKKAAAHLAGQDAELFFAGALALNEVTMLAIGAPNMLVVTL